MKIGIIITVKNCIEYTKQCVETIKTTKNYVIILVDDFSEDDTKTYFKQLSLLRNDIIVLTDLDTYSLAEKWNLGIDAAVGDSCDVFLICNNDIIFNKHTIDQLARRLQLAQETDERIGMVTAHNVKDSVSVDEIEEYPKVIDGTEAPSPDFSCFLLDKLVYDDVGEFDDGYCPCLSYLSKVLMEDGTYENMGTLVYNKDTRKVMSFDEDANQFVAKPIINWFKNKYDGEWFRPICKHTRRSKHGFFGATFTPDHLMLTKKGWVEIQELVPGDKLLTNELDLSETEFQLILGSSFGDGFIGRPNNAKAYFAVGHCEKQYEYLSYKREILKERIQNEFISEPGLCEIQGKIAIATEFSQIKTTFLRSLVDIHEILYIDNKKRISRKCLDLLNEQGLAFWYLDDGSISTFKKENWRQAAILYVGKQHSIEDIVRWFKDRFDLHVEPYDHKHKWTLRFSCDESEKFFELIAPFVPESMNYKLPSQFRYLYDTEIKYSDEYYYDTLIDIQKIDRNHEHKNRSYCLDVEDTHNFVTLSGVAHNCFFEDNDYHIRMIHASWRAISITSAPYYHYGSVTQNSIEGGMCSSPQFEANRDYFRDKFGFIPGDPAYDEVVQALEKNYV